MVRPGKGGYGSACKGTLRSASLRDNMDSHIIQFDADLSHPPETSPVRHMIELLQKWPVVIGSRGAMSRVAVAGIGISAEYC